jgi:uncharacterized protein (TIGR03083 family)
VTEDVRATFTDAGRGFVDLLDRIAGDGWERPGLGEWDLRALVGHTSRSLITVISYLQQPAPAEEVPSAAVYYELSARLIAADPTAVTERGRQAGLALGADPQQRVRALYGEAVAAVGAVEGDPVITTIAGGMRLSRYLPTRTFELTVHCLDIADACGVQFSPPAAALAESLHLAADVALLRGGGADVLLSLTGRKPLPAGYSVV